MTLKVTNLSVRYNNVIAVADLSFEVPAGEVVALVGANGAGKSSTLNALTGLVTRQGSIVYDGREMSGLATDEIVRTGIVQVAQGRQLFPKMSIQENLELGGFLLGRELIKTRVGEMMERFPILRERRGQMAGTLSGGEQQILAIARALVSGPRLLLLDEPCLGLSPIMIKRIAQVVRELNGQGLSILLAEQNTAFAFSLASRALVIENGRLFMSGSPSELRGNEEVRRSYLGV
jgi:branched-chain amino acid transport system ATP-binding protein